DGGQSWLCNPVTANATAVDRQWFGIYRNPRYAPSNGSIVYLDYDIAAGADCTGPGSAGNEFVVQRSLDGGKTFQPFVVADCNDGIAGNMEVNQTNGHVFA